MIKCVPSDKPLNGEVSQLSVDCGTSAIYHCNDGYKLVGTERRTCLNTGKYDGVLPDCEALGITFLIIFGK